MQLVRPKVVAMAVRMEMMMLMTIFQVSFLLSADIGFVDFLVKQCGLKVGGRGADRAP